MPTALIARTETLPAFTAPPPVSGSLRYYAGGDRVIEGDLHPVHGTPGPADIAEARRVLPQVEHLCRPPTLDLIAAWTRKLVPHLPRAPATDRELKLVVQGIAIACADMPVAVWTGETIAEALRTLTWWPAPADVRSLLVPHADRYRRLQAGLTRVVGAADRAAAPPRQPSAPSPEAVAHVAAIVAGFVSERAGADRTVQRGTTQGRARPMSDGGLLATYEAIEREGAMPGAGVDARQRGEAASIRVAMLRAKMAGGNVAP
jgi:hypothetical protein